MKNILVTTLAKNQLVIIAENEKIFQSYTTKICLISNDGKTYLDSEKWDYSRTTLKYLGQFLGMNKKEILEAIKNGSIELKNLN